MRVHRGISGDFELCDDVKQSSAETGRQLKIFDIKIEKAVEIYLGLWYIVGFFFELELSISATKSPRGIK